jgi:hypothetical protein
MIARQWDLSHRRRARNAFNSGWRFSVARRTRLRRGDLPVRMQAEAGGHEETIVELNS